MNNELIRKAEIKDITAIKEIYNYAIEHLDVTMDTKKKTHDDIFQWLLQRNARYPVYVSEKNEEVLGVAWLSPWSQRDGYQLMSEVSVYLNPLYFNQGLGGRLLDCLIDAGKKNGFTTLVGFMTSSNEKAKSILTHRHFSYSGLMRKVGFKFGLLLDIAIYQLFLDETT